MEDNQPIKVLWVENDPQVLSSYPLEASDYGVDLHPVSCWDDAVYELSKNYLGWDAIILDAKCKVHSDSLDKATPFLMEAFLSLTKMAEKNNCIIPWFVLSGGSEEEISDLIPEARNQWEMGREKAYYQKALTSERLELWRRIPIIVQECSNIVKLKSGPCRSVFKAITQINLPPEVESMMISLLLPLYFDSTKNEQYNDRYSYVRKIIEHIFRSMESHKIIPPTLIQNGKVNLSWSCSFLAGKTSDSYAQVIYKAITTKTMAGNLMNMVNVTGSMLHTEGADPTKSKDIQPYLDSVTNSPFLLQSFVLQLCDVLIWYENYLRQHDDDELNALNWEILVNA